MSQGLKIMENLSFAKKNQPKRCITAEMIAFLNESIFLSISISPSKFFLNVKTLFCNKTLFSKSKHANMLKISTEFNF